MRLCICLALSAIGPIAVAQPLSFAQAEGFGAYATGARTNLSSASVYHVTNLNDAGTGSFRDAVSQSNRFVVFDVSGIINLESVVPVSSNITIAGQTSAGGITLYGDRISFTNSHNLIARHFAVRKGSASGRTDTASIARGQNMIFDHMSITWGVDANFDINHDSGYVIDNITIQDSIIGQGLDNVGHSTGGLVQPGEGGSTSIIRTLWADNVTRNPKVRYENEFINNVVYGYETSGYIMGDTNNADSFANVIGNYFIEGPVNGNSPFASGTSRFNIYGDDNWVDGDRDGVLDGLATTSYPGATVVGSPHTFGTPTSTAMSAQEAVAYVIQHAGPSIIRDAVDTRLMEEVASYGTLGGVVQRESDLFPNFGIDPQYIITRARFTDGDYDGIADNWETAHGLSGSDASDWKSLSAAGYTQLEEYVNELGANGQIVVSSGGVWSSGATWSGAAPTLADELIIVGNLSNAGHAFARRLAVSGEFNMTGGTLDVFDTAEFSSGNSAINGGTATFGKLVIGAAGSSATLTVGGGGTIQGGAVTDSGDNGTLQLDGGTFRATGTPIISLQTIVASGGGTIDTGGFEGVHTGQISGTGALTKIGAKLTLSGDNSYSGGTLVSGVLRLAHNNATGTGTINIGSSFGQLELANGVTINNDLVTDYIFEIINVADNNATATYAGDIALARGGGQIRVQTTGSNALLILTGNADAGSSFFIHKTGAVDLRDNGALNAGDMIVGRDGGDVHFMMRNHSNANVDRLSMGGGKGLGIGRVTVRDHASLTVAGTIDLLSTSSSTSFSEFNLDGGIVTVGGFAKSSAGLSQTAEIDFNGGLLRYGVAGPNADFLPSLAGLAGNVQNGGARIDSNGQDITIAHQLIHDPVLSASFDGGLTKLGTGTLLLTANNTYNGTTTVAKGTLRVDGATGYGDTIVASGAKLAGNGEIRGNLLLHANASLQLNLTTDQLDIGEMAQLSGALELDGFESDGLELGDSFTILAYGSRMGVFDTITNLDLGDDRVLLPVYGASSLSFQAVLAGDVDADMDVDQDDLERLLGNWGASVAYGTNGDWAADGTVNTQDLLIVLRNWTSAAAPHYEVPEPGTLALLATGLALLRRPR